MGAWDLLLSITAKAMLAAEVLRPGQLVSIVPGCLAISRKTSLVRGGACALVCRVFACAVCAHAACTSIARAHRARLHLCAVKQQHNRP